MKTPLSPGRDHSGTRTNRQAWYCPASSWTPIDELRAMIDPVDGEAMQALIGPLVETAYSAGLNHTVSR